MDKNIIVMIYPDKVRFLNEETAYEYCTFFYLPHSNNGETIMTISTNIFDVIEHYQNTGYNIKYQFA